MHLSNGQLAIAALVVLIVVIVAYVMYVAYDSGPSIETVAQSAVNDGYPDANRGVPASSTVNGGSPDTNNIAPGSSAVKGGSPDINHSAPISRHTSQNTPQRRTRQSTRAGRSVGSKRRVMCSEAVVPGATVGSGPGATAPKDFCPWLCDVKYKGSKWDGNWKWSRYNNVDWTSCNCCSD